jgi:hypothetical protein
VKSAWVETFESESWMMFDRVSPGWADSMNRAAPERKLVDVAADCTGTERGGHSLGAGPKFRHRAMGPASQATIR